MTARPAIGRSPRPAIGRTPSSAIGRTTVSAVDNCPRFAIYPEFLGVSQVPMAPSFSAPAPLVLTFIGG